ncbi:zf-HC2 domain-containing protein [bacterium]|nr:zf-HC2 domain-containing protein [bacterium]
MNCQEALSLLYDIIDKEASEVDTRQVKEHLEKCGHCSEIYRVEQQVNAFLKAKCTDSNPEERLDTLKTQVIKLLDREDGGGTDPLASGGDRKYGAPPITGLTFTRYIAAAAALVIVVWGAFLAADLFRHHDEHFGIERIHLAANEQPAEFATVESTGRAFELCARSMHFAPTESVDGFRLLGARDIQIDGVPAVHLLYENGKSGISVFVMRKDQFNIPPSLKAQPTTLGGHTFYDHNCRGCRLIYREVGDLIVITASECREVDLPSFIPGAAA